MPEVCVHLEALTQWTFDFDFDKVLFFERQPGGTGKVIELLRAHRGVETPGQPARPHARLK